jgi:hypothetical protein
MSQSLPNCVAAENIELYHCSSIDEQAGNAGSSARKISDTATCWRHGSRHGADLRSARMAQVYLERPQGGQTHFCEKPMTMTMADAYGSPRARR